MKNIRIWYRISFIAVIIPFIAIFVSGYISKYSYQECSIYNEIPACPVGKFFAGLSWGLAHMSAFVIAIGLILLLVTLIRHSIILFRSRRTRLGILTTLLSATILSAFVYLIYLQSLFSL